MSVADLPKTIQWVGGLDGHVAIIDQTLLPGQLHIADVCDIKSMWEAIQRLRVRGAPAIGIAAAMGVVLAVRDCPDDSTAALKKKVREGCECLSSARPTAVNLFWALDRMRDTALRALRTGDVASAKRALLEEAKRIRDQDAATCRAIGDCGERLITDGMTLLTHCNAGSLATAEYGTATAPMYTAHNRGRRFRVFASETRPLLQGARLTAWELDRAGVDVTLLCEGMVGSLMQTGAVDLVITGADRIAANGDVANKIGTYNLAVLSEAHGVPFYVAAPTNTFDSSAMDGTAIPIEERNPDEIRQVFGYPVAPPEVPCFCPAFDVTPARLIRGFITECGIIQPVTREAIAQALPSSS